MIMELVEFLRWDETLILLFGLFDQKKDKDLIDSLLLEIFQLAPELAAKCYGNNKACLGQCPGQVVDYFIDVFRNKDFIFEIREKAAKALGHLHDARAIEPLIKALKDEDRGARMVAASDLGNLHDARAIEPLIKALKDEDWWVREAAASDLGNLHDARAIEPLIKALKDKDVRWAAAEALGRIIAKMPEKERFDFISKLVPKITTGALGHSQSYLVMEAIQQSTGQRFLNILRVKW